MLVLGRKCLAFLLTAALLFSLFGTAAADTRSNGPSPSPFLDTHGTRYQQAVDALYALRIVSGLTENKFDPGAQVTRAQMTAMVVRALGSAVRTPTADPFTDVRKDHWAAGVIATGADLGFVKGEDGYFHPDQPMTYSEAVAMLLRAVGHEPLIQGTYPIGFVLHAKDLGLVDGLDWGLDKPVSRGDLALMLYRTVFLVNRGGIGPTLSQSVFSQAGSISIEPASDVIVTGFTQLSAVVLDWAGKKLDNRVQWSVVAGSATVDASGALTVTGRDPIVVEARTGNVSVSKTYSPMQSLTVVADKTAIRSGEVVQLTASAKTSTQNTVPVKVNWSVVSGTATVTDDGKVTVTGTSAVKVKGWLGTLSSEVTINVIGGISLAPQNVTVGANQEVAFKATVTDASGQAVDLPVTWSVVGGGTIDQTGKYRAGTAPGTVVAKAGELSASTSVRVLGRIEVSPSVVALKKGDARQFTATVYSAANEPMAVPVRWSVEPSTLGFFSADGKLFARESGSGHIVATYGGISTRIPVTVAGTPVALRVSASSTSVPANGSSTVVVTARLVDANGATAAGVDSVLLALSSSRLGTLDKSVVPVVDGVATATLTVGTQPGAYYIYASAPGTALASTTVGVTTTVPTINHIQLEVYPNPMAADGVSRTQVKATLIDHTGSSMVNNTNNPIMVYLSQGNTAAGHLAGTQIQIPAGQRSSFTYFVAGTAPGSTVITGTSSYPVYSATATSQIVGGAYRLKIRPAAATTAKADGTSEVVLYVEVQDANGNVRTGDNSVYVSANAAAGSNTLAAQSQQTIWGVATLKLKTSKAGTYDVNVWATNQTLQGDSTQVTFTAGTPYKLALSLDPNTSLAADARTTALLRAKLLDVSGNVVTGATNQVRFTRSSSSQLVINMPGVTSANAVNGEATLQITTTAGVGTDYFLAEADGLIPSSMIAVTTRITGVPVKLSVLPLQEPNIPAGGSTIVRVAVFDQLNQIATGDNGRIVTLNATNGAAVTGPTPTVNGIATFTVSNTVAGGVGLTATAGGVSPDMSGRILTVAPGIADRVILTATPEALSADGVSKTWIRASVVDRFGNPSGGSTNVTLSLSTGEFVTLSSAYLNTNGNVMLTAKSVPGTTTITGVTTSYPVTPLVVSTYRPGVPSKVVIDTLPAAKEAGNAYRNQVVVKARILDNNGNLVTSLSTGSDLTAMALMVTGSTGTNSTTLSMQNNTGLSQNQISPNGVTIGSATVSAGIGQFTLTNTKAETVTLTPVVFYRGVRLASESATLTTMAGPATRLTLSTSSTVVPMNYPTPLTVTAAVTDSYGNPANTAEDTISFTLNSPYFTQPSPSSVTTFNGTATTIVTSNLTNTGGAASLLATSSRYGFSAAVSLVADRLPDKPTVVARDSNGIDSTVTSADSGARILIVAPYRNSEQQIMVYVNGVNVPLYSDVTWSTPVGSIASGGGSLTGYIRLSDLGGAGIKDIRAVVSTPLGLSPLSDGATLTVQ